MSLFEKRLEKLNAILKDRQSRYGLAPFIMDDIAKQWAAFLGYPVSVKQVSVMMTLLKIARIKNSQTYHLDDILDAMGYLALMPITPEEEKNNDEYF